MDKSGKLHPSENYKIKSGFHSLDLTGFKSAAQARLNIELVQNKWGAVPVMQTAILKGKTDGLRWSTTKEWERGDISNGLRIER
jgi:hypothetical protein